MGVHITFVRSLKMDRWKLRELKQMELGGNKAAKAFYEKNGMLQAGQPPEHTNPALTRYKNDLKLRAEKACGAIVQEQAPVKVEAVPIKVAEKKETIPIKKPEIIKIAEEPKEKKRTFVEQDIFDFSELKQAVPTPVVKAADKETKKEPKPAVKESLEDFAMGGFFQGKSVSLGPAKNLNAKKLDIDFDADDFFNQFDEMKKPEPKKAAPVVAKTEIEKPTEPEVSLLADMKAPEVTKKTSADTEDVSSRYE